VDSEIAELRIRRLDRFRIIQMLATNSRVQDHNNETGDDHGSIGLSGASLFYTGNNGTARASWINREHRWLSVMLPASSMELRKWIFWFYPNIVERSS
jgi:hypothetical protein